MLDTARSDADNRHSYLFTAPVRVLTADTLTDVPPLLEAIDEVVEQGGYVAGYLAYEAGFAFEDRAGTPAGDQPLAWFGVYEAPVVLDEQAVCRLLDEEESTSFALTNARLAIDRDDYLEKIEAVKAHIHAGDVYQVNVTDRVVFNFDGSSRALYRALRRQQRVSYGAYVHTGETEILCCSPERFFKRTEDHIAVRPMKGTAHRGLTLEEDQVQQRSLAADPKSRAENLMIVDLMRNDLSRCCRPGSVQVRDLFTTEVYETLIQMISTIEGRLREDISYADLFRALFPCG
ncbi:MAG: chorismate-binding protein, partial [Rhodothermales bacterium]